MNVKIKNEKIRASNHSDTTFYVSKIKLFNDKTEKKRKNIKVGLEVI